MKFQKGLIVLMLILILTPHSILGAKNRSQSSISTNPIETYALLFDQFVFGPQDSAEAYSSAFYLRDVLISLGWREENISLFLAEKNNEQKTVNISKSVFIEQLDYLENTVDENDLVFIYIESHGHTYLRDELHFTEWFFKEFYEINTKNKVVFIESCYAGEFVRFFNSKETYALSSVNEYELAILRIGWNITEWELTENPFTGGISSHFWIKALNNSAADASNDGIVSLNEAYDYALPSIRQCYNETLENNKNMAEYLRTTVGYTYPYPNPIEVDKFHGDLTLNATEYILNNDLYQWEEDTVKPIIYCEDLAHYTIVDKYVTIEIEVEEQSNFEYSVFVNDTLEEWGDIDKEEESNWKYNFTFEIVHPSWYNIKFHVIDIFGNQNTKQVMIKSERNSTSETTFVLDIGFSILLLFIVVTKRRKNEFKEKVY